MSTRQARRSFGLRLYEGVRQDYGCCIWVRYLCWLIWRMHEKGDRCLKKTIKALQGLACNQQPLLNAL
jgi:hypothetical protein